MSYPNPTNGISPAGLFPGTIYNNRFMTFRVHVSMKATVLDPQGQTICSALKGHGHPSVADVRQGKFFDIRMNPGSDREQAAAEIDEIAREVLTNPVIEDFQVEYLES